MGTAGARWSESGARGQDLSERAEAWGAAAALHLILHHCPPVPGAPPTIVAGDNPNIVRLCAAQGKVRNPQTHAILAGPLARLALSGRRTAWVLLPRRLNQAAHEAANDAAKASAVMQSDGDFSTPAVTRIVSAAA